MSNRQQLEEKAAELGFCLEKGEMKFAGYVLVNQNDGTKPLGDRYTASLKQVAEYLERYVEDASIAEEAVDDDDSSLDDIETGLTRPNPAPTGYEMRKSLDGHPNEEAIKGIVFPPPGPPRETREGMVGLMTYYLRVVSPTFTKISWTNLLVLLGLLPFLFLIYVIVFFGLYTIYKGVIVSFSVWTVVAGIFWVAIGYRGIKFLYSMTEIVRLHGETNPPVR